MKITVNQLRRIIKEEVKRSLLRENFEPPEGAKKLYDSIFKVYGDDINEFKDEVMNRSGWKRAEQAESEKGKIASVEAALHEIAETQLLAVADADVNALATALYDNIFAI